MNLKATNIRFKHLLIMTVLLCQFSVFSQDTNSLFVTANKLYKTENYNEAIETYHKIEKQKVQSAELFFNLANAYYKINKVAPSIYYYEKALQLAPNKKDIKFNLNFAKKMTIDNIEKMPTTVFQKISQNFIQKLSYNNWAYLSVFFGFLFAILFLFYHFSYQTSKKRIFFITSILSVLFVIVGLIFSFHTYKITKSKKEAIIFASQTSIKNAPMLSAEPVFELHEGTKVQILENVDNWKKIKIADGQTGWVVATELKEL